MIYIIHPDVEIWNYVLEGVDDEVRVKTRPLNRYCHKWKIFLRKYFPNLRWPWWMLISAEMGKEITQLKSDDTIVVCDYSAACLIWALSSILHPSVRRFYWIWNPILDHEAEKYNSYFSVLANENFIPTTFDPDNALHYGIELRNQFFRMHQTAIESAPLYDFYFLGFSKNREKQVEEMKHQLKGYRLFFKLVHHAQEYITYEENLENVRRSRCLVEIVQQGQAGMTLRPLEALAFKKKLISNNQALLHMDFYHPKNIFIVGHDSFSNINSFLLSDWHEIDPIVLSNYDIEAWIQSFQTF